MRQGWHLVNSSDIRLLGAGGDTERTHQVQGLSTKETPRWENTTPAPPGMEKGGFHLESPSQQTALSPINTTNYAEQPHLKSKETITRHSHNTGATPFCRTTHPSNISLARTKTTANQDFKPRKILLTAFHPINNLVSSQLEKTQTGAASLLL